MANELGELRRNNFQVLKDILIAAGGGVIKTRIVHGSNTNFKLFKEYADYAIEHGLMVQNGELFAITDKGREFCCRVIELEAMLAGE